MSEQRPDPRKRPPDPAGTQPKVDPESLRPATPASAPPPPAAPQLGSGGGEDLPCAGPERSAVTPGELTAPLRDAAAPAPAVAAPAPELTVAPPPALSGAVAAADAPAPSPSPALLPAAPSAPHAPRFQFLFGALGALAIAVILLAIALLGAPRPAPERPWSSWRPSEDGVDPAQQIADHVAPQYRLDDGQQIVQVTGGPPALKGEPLTVGVVKSGQTPAALVGNSVLYQLCGEGVDCSIKQGRPSVQRALLLSREALELALYTFRYVSGTSQVIVTIPPAPPGHASGSTNGLGESTRAGGARASGSAAGTSAAGTSAADASGTSAATGTTRIVNHALLFSQQNLASELDRPLHTTLVTAAPRVSQMDRSPDATIVRLLTEPRIYDFVISESQQSGPVMLLEPPGLGG